jgi:prevent-host-death family protein
METVGAYTAKTHLAQLLKRVSKGEKITISKHGVPVATLQPPEVEQKRPVKKVIAELRAFRQKHALDGLSIREMIEQGRR